MNVQKNGPVVSAVIVAMGSLIGAAVASFFTHLTALNQHGYPASTAFCDWLICSAGAVVGGLVFSWVGKR